MFTNFSLHEILVHALPWWTKRIYGCRELTAIMIEHVDQFKQVGNPMARFIVRAGWLDGLVKTDAGADSLGCRYSFLGCHNGIWGFGINHFSTLLLKLAIRRQPEAFGPSGPGRVFFGLGTKKSCFCLLSLHPLLLGLFGKACGAKHRKMPRKKNYPSKIQTWTPKFLPARFRDFGPATLCLKHFIQMLLKVLQS